MIVLVSSKWYIGFAQVIKPGILVGQAAGCAYKVSTIANR